MLLLALHLAPAFVSSIAPLGQQALLQAEQLSACADFSSLCMCKGKTQANFIWKQKKKTRCLSCNILTMLPEKKKKTYDIPFLSAVYTCCAIEENAIKCN